VWVNSAWLDGDAVKSRWAAHVQAKLDGRSYWSQEKNQQEKFAYTHTTRLFIT
jgi:hypothetical protein